LKISLKRLENLILSAVNYAHKRNTVHRDIKPSNFIITQDNQIKILDFGIAKIIDNEAFNMTKAGSKVGTILYMSPEQVKGITIDHRTDIYSLGVLLYTLLSGISPYKNTTSEYEIYTKIIQEPLPDINVSNVKISNNISEIIKIATHKSPEKRFQSCEEFQQSLFESINKVDTKRQRIKIPRKKEPKKGIHINGSSFHRITNKKILSLLLDLSIPVIFLIQYIFLKGGNKMQYSLFDTYLWTIEDKTIPMKYFYKKAWESLWDSFAGEVGIAKFSFSSILILFIIIQIISFISKKRSIGSLVFQKRN